MCWRLNSIEAWDFTYFLDENKQTLYINKKYQVSYQFDVDYYLYLQYPIDNDVTGAGTAENIKENIICTCSITFRKKLWK